MIGIILGIVAMFWFFVTMIAFAATGSIYNFFQSLGCIVVIIGWIIILAVWPIYKKLNREEETW